MKFAFFTLGCKVNLFETQALEQLARQRGHEITEKDADAVIINTCTVTSVSDHKNVRAFHKLRREHPRAVLAACGCFAQTDPERIRQTGEIDLICGTSDRAAVLDQCERLVAGQAAAPAHPAPAAPPAFESLPAGVPAGRTRALLKIEDGCNNYCSYCIIPYARGGVRSLPEAKVLSQVRALAQAGVREIVLTGIELSSYGLDLQAGETLTGLLGRLLPAFAGVRFRLGSLDPRTADEQFCAALCKHENLAKHFHLSLQSGCDSVLRRMGRRYTAEEYYQAVQRLRGAFAGCSVTTDLIVGFPQESEEEFLQTLSFLQRCALASVHVFPFSKRAGTRAAALDGQLPQAVKAQRAVRAKEVAAALSEAHRAAFLGKTLAALPEHRTGGGLWAAHSTYGFPIYIEGSGVCKNEPVRVRVSALWRDGVRAERQDEANSPPTCCITAKS